MAKEDELFIIIRQLEMDQVSLLSVIVKVELLTVTLHLKQTGVTPFEQNPRLCNRHIRYTPE